ncbi:MAG TPA: hypothetical protein VFY99_09400 [Solirubrobacterales bacterium]
MNDLTARIAAEQDEQIRREAIATSRRRAAAAREAGEAGRLSSRPDRVAMWAFLMAIAITIAAAASSQAASSGGIDATAGDGDREDTDRALATWYGPGLWGNETACGQTLRHKTVGVAHRRLPCGTEVTIVYKGATLTTEVIDRARSATTPTGT